MLIKNIFFLNALFQVANPEFSIYSPIHTLKGYFNSLILHINIDIIEIIFFVTILSH